MSEEWFRVTFEAGDRRGDDAPLVAALGWDTEFGEEECEPDIGRALYRVLKAVNGMHSEGIIVEWVLAYAADCLDDGSVCDFPEGAAFLAAAKAYAARLRQPPEGAS